MKNIVFAFLVLSVTIQAQDSTILYTKYETSIWDHFEAGDIVGSIPADTRIIGVLKPYTRFYAVTFDTLKGYVNYASVVTEVEKLSSDSLLIKQKTNAAHGLQQRRSYLIVKYGERLGLEIFQGNVLIGMTKEMILESWGKPTDKKGMISSSTDDEYWFYGETLLVIENGVLTRINY